MEKLAGRTFIITGGTFTAYSVQRTGTSLMKRPVDICSVPSIQIKICPQ